MSTAPQEAELASALDERNRRRLLAVVLVGMFTTAFPYTVLSASLDTIRIDLDTSLSTISWLQVAPTLAAGVAVPIFGKLCDLWGARRMFLSGIGLTAVFSVLTACAWNVGSLIAIRTVGQLVGAAAGPAGFTIVTHWFGGDDRSRAIGRLGSVAAIAPITGVAVGGPLVDLVGWQMLFLLQAVPATIGFVLGVRWLPDTTARRQVSFDLAGAALLAATVVTALFGLNRTRGWGLGHPVVIGCFVLAPVLAAGFLVVEHRRAHPLVPPAILRRRDFGRAFATLWIIQATFLGSSIIVPLLLQRRYGYALTAVSAIVAIRPVGFAFGSWLSPWLRRRIGAPRAQLLAAGLMTLASSILVPVAIHRIVVVLLVGFVLAGFASGMAYTTVLTSINELADPSDVGVVNGVAAMMGTIGGATGVTLVAAIVADSGTAGPFVTSFGLLVGLSALSILMSGGLRRSPVVVAEVTDDASASVLAEGRRG